MLLHIEDWENAQSYMATCLGDQEELCMMLLPLYQDILPTEPT